MLAYLLEGEGHRLDCLVCEQGEGQRRLGQAVVLIESQGQADRAILEGGQEHFLDLAGFESKLEEVDAGVGLVRETDEHTFEVLKDLLPGHVEVAQSAVGSAVGGQ